MGRNHVIKWFCTIFELHRTTYHTGPEPILTPQEIIATMFSWSAILPISDMYHVKCAESSKYNLNRQSSWQMHMMTPLYAWLCPKSVKSLDFDLYFKWQRAIFNFNGFVNIPIHNSYFYSQRDDPWWRKD